MKNLKKIITSYSNKSLFVLLILFSFFIVNQSKSATHKIIPIQTFVGVYHGSTVPYAYYNVTVGKDNTLIVQRLDLKQQFILTRKSELSFEAKNNGSDNITINFKRNATGKIDLAILDNGEKWINVRNYDKKYSKSISKVKFKELEGKYQFKGKNNLYIRVTAIDGGLEIKQLWDGHEGHYMCATDTDFFTKNPLAGIRFTKDSSDKVSPLMTFNHEVWIKVKDDN